jgi:diacylglycerol kinase family enzyme
MKKRAMVNTKCCWAKKNAYAKYVIGRIKKDTGAYVAFTERPGHAEKIAKDSSGYDAIIAVGGDGTISEVVNGMDMETQTAIVMPLGSANSFARGLGIISPTKAFEVIKKNETAKIDLIHCQFETNNEKFERYIVVTSGLGFASATAAFANRCLKMAGPFCYSLSACFKPFNQEVVSAKMQIDRDSAFNLLYTKTNALTQYLWNISIITKTYFYYPGEKTANRLHIILLKPSLFMLDGEIFDSVKEIRYSVIPRSLRILT